jgi:hypothetical protein
LREELGTLTVLHTAATESLRLAEAEVKQLQKERDDLLWLLNHEFEEQNPEVVVKPLWMMLAANLREAAEAEPPRGEP